MGPYALLAGLSPPKQTGPRFREDRSAGVPGLEPRMLVPETSVLPITPYPTALDLLSGFPFRKLSCASAREITIQADWRKVQIGDYLHPAAPKNPVFPVIRRGNEARFSMHFAELLL